MSSGVQGTALNCPPHPSVPCSLILLLFGKLREQLGETFSPNISHHFQYFTCSFKGPSLCQHFSDCCRWFQWKLNALNEWFLTEKSEEEHGHEEDYWCCLRFPPGPTFPQERTEALGKNDDQPLLIWSLQVARGMTVNRNTCADFTNISSVF